MIQKLAHVFKSASNTAFTFGRRLARTSLKLQQNNFHSNCTVGEGIKKLLANSQTFQMNNHLSA